MKDERLIRKAISGDSSAFCKLVEKYFDSVCSALCSLITDPLDAEEIAQEAFLRAYLHLRKLRRPSSFRSWVMRIAFNLAMDQARRRMREPQFISLSEIDPDRLQMPSFEDDILRDELVREASEAIDGLPDMDGEMLRKWIFDGRSYRDLSEEYNMSYDAVAKRIRRGLKKVKRKVRERLSGIILIPWEKMLKLIGGVVMKVSTKVAITGAVVMMLGGVGIWMTMHRGEEKPIPKANKVKVERQASVRAPAMVVGRPEKKKEDDLTFEEFNRLLDELFNQALQDKGGEGSSRKANGKKAELKDNMVSSSNTEENVTSSPESEEVKGKKGDDGLSELIQKILDLATEHQALLEEYRVLSDEYEVCKDPVRKHEIYLEWDKLGQKLDDLEWKAKFLFVEYHLRTGDTAAFEPGGWIDSLGVLKAAKIERDADGVWHVQWLPGKYLH
ncbi:sigma-70 family RNA polymerase sigma factor [Candidatus Poribacteria bacterium]|nr:sigma-70 family RNA polymerase sigma factor [Candidatus Poribacteria bacterium]